MSAMRDPTPAERGILFDATGRAFRVGAYGDTHWPGASQDHELKAWQPPNSSADAANLPEIDTLRDRARDLARGEPIADATTSAFDLNVVGSRGLRVTATPDYKALGWTKERADKWAQEVTSLARSYFGSKDCDATRHSSHYGLQSLTVTNTMQAGGVIVVPILRAEGTQCRYRTAFRLIEIDHLSNPDDVPDTKTLRGGVQYDEEGIEILGYHLQDQHPGDVLIGMADFVRSWTYVPAYTSWGRQRIFHIFERRRIGESLGTSLLAALMPEYKTLSDYKKAEVQAALNNALVAAFYESNAPFEALAKLFPNPRDYAEYRAKHLAKLRPGATIPLPLGDKLSAFNPGRPNPNFASFVEAVLRHACAGLGLPYESVLRDFSKTNYSSARAALLEAWRAYSRKRVWLAEQFCQPCFEVWFEEAVHLGEIPDVDWQFLYDHWEALTRCRWSGDGRGWVDPVKEAAALKIRLSSGVSNLEKECAEQGEDWREVLEQAVIEREAYRLAGVQYPGDTLPGSAENAVVGAAMRDEVENPRAVPGHNGPPSDDEEKDAA